MRNDVGSVQPTRRSFRKRRTNPAVSLARFTVALSPLEEQRFGIRTARGLCVKKENVAEILSYTRTESVKLLIARCPAGEFETVHALEKSGFRLMDSLVYYGRSLADRIPGCTATVSIRHATSTDADVLEEIAKEAFTGYIGHYHADPRLPEDACDKVYSSWARRSCVDSAVADRNLVAARQAETLGFLTLRLAEQAEGLLFATRPTARGQGIGRTLMAEGLREAAAWGAKRFIISTQVINLPPQAVWTSLGFQLDSVFYTFHKWFQD